MPAGAAPADEARGQRLQGVQVQVLAPAAGDEAVEQVADHAGACEELFLDRSKPDIAARQRGFDGA